MSHWPSYKFLAFARTLVRPNPRNLPFIRFHPRTLSTMGSLDAKAAIIEQVKFDILTKNQEAVCGRV